MVTTPKQTKDDKIILNFLTNLVDTERRKIIRSRRRR